MLSFSVQSGKQPGPLGKGDLHVGGAPAVKLLQIHGESNLSQLSRLEVCYFIISIREVILPTDAFAK